MTFSFPFGRSFLVDAEEIVARCREARHLAFRDAAHETHARGRRPEKTAPPGAFARHRGRHPGSGGSGSGARRLCCDHHRSDRRARRSVDRQPLSVLSQQGCRPAGPHAASCRRGPIRAGAAAGGDRHQHATRGGMVAALRAGGRRVERSAAAPPSDSLRGDAVPGRNHGGDVPRWRADHRHRRELPGPCPGRDRSESPVGVLSALSHRGRRHQRRRRAPPGRAHDARVWRGAHRAPVGVPHGARGVAVTRMDLAGCFTAYADDFERSYADGNWLRLEPYFASDAVYECREPAVLAFRVVGRAAIFERFATVTAAFDRRFDSRSIRIGPPTVAGARVVVTGVVLYTLSGAPLLELPFSETATYR